VGRTAKGNPIASDDGNEHGNLPGLSRMDDRQSQARADRMLPSFPVPRLSTPVTSIPLVEARTIVRSSTQPALTSSHRHADKRHEGLTYDDPFDRKSNLCLDGRINRPGKHVSASGGYADVWEGFLDTRKVAVKVLRPFANTGKRMDQNKLLRVRLSPAPQPRI